MKELYYIETEFYLKGSKDIMFNEILSELLLMIPYKDYPINHFIDILNSIKYKDGSINITIINLNKIEISIYFSNLLNENFKLKSINENTQSYKYIVNEITQSYEYILYIFNNSYGNTNLSGGLTIKLKDKIKLAPLRRFILNKLFKNKTMHKYLERVSYSNKVKIYITENDVVNINYKYEYEYDTNYINFTHEVVSFCRDEKLKELFPNYFKTFNVKFNKIHKVIENYFKTNNNTPFKILRKVINLKSIYFFL